MDRSEVEEFPSLFFHRPSTFPHLLFSLITTESASTPFVSNIVEKKNFLMQKLPLLVAYLKPNRSVKIFWGGLFINISKFQFDQDREPAWKLARADVASSLNTVVYLFIWLA